VYILLVLSSSSVLCWLVNLFLVPKLRFRFVDYPGKRSSHVQPTPRGGGLSFVIVGLLFSCVSLRFGDGSRLLLLPLIGIPLAIVGLIDDRLGLPLVLRYVVHLLTASLCLGLSPLLQRSGLFSLPISPLYLSLCLFLLIAVTAVINFTNFMDGLDGLLAGCMAVTIAALALALDAPSSLWALVGALLGFLLWNWSPAKVFMGDVGSTFLGAVFAGLVLQASSWTEAFGCLLVATPLLGDACLCVSRRLLAGQRVFQAHRLHLFQRLHQAGWSHARVSLTYIGATAVLAVAMLAGGWPWVLGLAVVELLVGVWLDQCVAVPFALASKS